MRVSLVLLFVVLVVGPPPPLPSSSSSSGFSGLLKTYQQFMDLALEDPTGSPANLTPNQEQYGQLCTKWITADKKLPKSGGTIVFGSSGVTYSDVEKNLLAKKYTITKAAVGTGVSGVVSLGTKKSDSSAVALKEQFFVDAGEVSKIVRETGLQMHLVKFGKSKKKKITMDVYEAWAGPRPTLTGYPPNRPNTASGQRSDVSLWIAMEAAEDSLEDRWGISTKVGKTTDLNKCPELKEFANTLFKLAERYELMHAAGIVHRDCKMDNIMMQANEPYPIDFGLSRPVNKKTQNVADDVASFGKMILEFSSSCFRKTYGQTADPVNAACDPKPLVGFFPNSFNKYIAAMPKTLPEDFPLWKRIMSLGMKMFKECGSSGAVCKRPYFSSVKGELNAIKMKAVVSSMSG